MSYDQSSSPRPRKGGAGLIFLIILGIGGYLLFSSLGKQPDGEGAGGVDTDTARSTGREFPDQDSKYAVDRDFILGTEKDNSTAKKKMPTTGGTGSAGDWDMQDAGTSKSAGGGSFQPKNNKTQNGDWAMEDVDGKKKEPQFKFSNSADKNPPAKSGGDWAMDDVESKKPPKKTQKGDWAIEDAGTKKK